MYNKWYDKKPDTKEEVQAKLTFTEREAARMTVSIAKMKKDLLQNHLTTSETHIRMKKKGLQEAERTLSRMQIKIQKYTEKLKTFKSNDDEKRAF